MGELCFFPQSIYEGTELRLLSFIEIHKEHPLKKFSFKYSKTEFLEQRSTKMQMVNYVLKFIESQHRQNYLPLNQAIDHL